MSSYNGDSRSNAGTQAAWIRAPITGNLLEIPGIGEATVNKLRDENITTTQSLLGKFLMMKDSDTTAIEHCARFFEYLKSIGVTGGYTSTITTSVAEKVNTWIPGSFDSSAYEC